MKSTLWGMILLSVTVSFAGTPQVKQTRTSTQAVKTWILGTDTVSVSAQNVFAKNKLNVGTLALLSTDAQKRIMVTRSLSQNARKYEITDFSGHRLGTFSLPANPDIPQPRLLVDFERKQLIQLYANGLLEARDFNGNKRWQKPIDVGRLFHYENSYFAETDNLGNITVLFSYPSESGWISRLLRFSAQGNRLAAKSFSRNRALHLGLSSDGKWTAVLFTKEDGSQGRKELVSFILDEAYQSHFQGSEAYREVGFVDSSWVVFMSRDAFWGVQLQNDGASFRYKVKPGHVLDHMLVSAAGVVSAVSGIAQESEELYFTNIRVYRKDVRTSSYFEYDEPRNMEYLPHNFFLGSKGTLWLGGRFGLYVMNFGRQGGAR